MQHKILITGASGYLGGTLLNRLTSTIATSEHKFYALVRGDKQVEAVKQYGVEPLTFNPFDEAEVRQNVLDKGIDIVFYLIDAGSSRGQVNFIKALGELKKSTGCDAHFLHVSYPKAEMRLMCLALSNGSSDHRSENILFPHWSTH